DEYAQLHEWGNRAVLTRRARALPSVPVLFGEQVVRTPNAVAVTHGERSWTYRELDEASNRLANLLIRHGAAPGECVALLMPRSVEAVVSILAVLKTGAAYLPVDPLLPASRVNFMLDDAAPVVAVSTARLAQRLEGCGLLVVDVSDPAIETQSTTAVPA
ncbi:UNVERIFIED_CONTAM: AMP-binding protein, partial [Bacillus amyloliquefaciens DSM 7 = ATCC 23350]